MRRCFRSHDQDKPCEGAGAKMDVRPNGGARAVVPPANSPGAGSQSAGQPAVDGAPLTEAQRVEKYIAESQRSRRKQLLEVRLVPEARDSLRDLRASCDGQLAALRARKGAANNNLAGATWEVSLSNEMSAVATRCDTRQRELREELDALLQECRGLKGCL